MGSPIGSIRNVKIFVLYLMENINYPLDFITINDIVMQTQLTVNEDINSAFDLELNRDAEFTFSLEPYGYKILLLK